MRDSIVTGIESLLEEKAYLEEEIRQLRVAVRLYTELARRLAANSDPSPRYETAGPRLVAA
jgi:hypothetical protein